DGIVTFDVGAYDTRHALVIDPIVAYSTYISGLRPIIGAGQSFINAIALDGAGNAYVVGSTGANDFAWVNGIAPQSWGGSFVAKLSATGGTLLFSSYFPAGNGLNAIAIDGAGNIYVAGNSSGGFPTTSGTFQPAKSGASSEPG